MIRIILILFAIAIVFSIQAQFNNLGKTFELKPIMSNGNKFFYGNTKVRKGYSLQIPMQSLEDAEVNRRFKNYKNVRLAGRLSWFVPVGFLFIASSQNIFSTSRSESDALGWLTFGAFLTNIGCNITSNAILRKGIDRYNVLIFNRNTAGIQMEKIPNGSRLMAFGIVHYF